MAKKTMIGTHNGTFHTDEALACFMLRKLPEYTDAQIVRSRDQQVLDLCQIVVDVGGVYDPSKHRYDHHQNTFQDTIETLRPDLASEVRLSSAGLIYHHFGERILEAVVGKTLDKVQLHKLFSYVYYHFVQELDAVDNGIPMHKEGIPRYQFHTSLSSRVARLQPAWNYKGPSNQDELFEKAMAMAGQEFVECVHRFQDEWWPARSIVQSAVDNRFKTHESGAIIEIQFCPWKEHLFEIEEEQGIEGSIKYAVFQDSNGSWRTACVPQSIGNYLLREALYEAWRGRRDEDLQKLSGVADAVFVHANGFIGGAASREGSLELAARTLQLNEEDKNHAVK